MDPGRVGATEKRELFSFFPAKNEKKEKTLSKALPVLRGSFCVKMSCWEFQYSLRGWSEHFLWVTHRETHKTQPWPRPTPHPGHGRWGGRPCRPWQNRKFETAAVRQRPGCWMVQPGACFAAQKDGRAGETGNGNGNGVAARAPRSRNLILRLALNNPARCEAELNQHGDG